MAETIAVTRARIACRIYLALYDAGHEGLIFATGADFVPGTPIPEDHDLTREVIQRLRDLGAVQELSASFPGITVLHPDLRSRMDLPISPPLTVVERFRRDLAALERGDMLVADDFLNLESMVRTGETRVRGL